MNQGTGWAAVLKRAVYARMEELSFRSAVATAAGVLAITGAGVTLTVTSGGSQQLAIAPPAVPAVGAQSTAAPSSPAVSSPAAAPAPSASPARVVPEAEYQPATGAAPQRGTTNQAASSPASPVISYPGPTLRPVAGEPWRSPRSFRPGWPPAFRPPQRTANWFKGSRDASAHHGHFGHGRP